MFSNQHVEIESLCIGQSFIEIWKSNQVKSQGTSCTRTIICTEESTLEFEETCLAGEESSDEELGFKTNVV